MINHIRTCTSEFLLKHPNIVPDKCFNKSVLRSDCCFYFLILKLLWVYVKNMLLRNKLFVGEIIVCSAHSTLLVSLFFELYVFFRADKLYTVVKLFGVCERIG